MGILVSWIREKMRKRKIIALGIHIFFSFLKENGIWKIRFTNIWHLEASLCVSTLKWKNEKQTYEKIEMFPLNNLGVYDEWLMYNSPKF